MTISWRVALLLTIGIIPIVISPTPQTLLLWVLFVAILVLIDAVLAPSPRKLEIRREEVKSVRAGETTESVLHVEGASHRMHGVLRDAWQPSAGAANNRHAFNLRPTSTATFTTVLVPKRRGVLKAKSVTIRSWGPMRLAAIQTTFDLPGTLLALPEFPSRALLPAAISKLQLVSGQILARMRGQGTEFDSLREWVNGDDPRSIDWRATARTDEVMVRTWRPERDRHIVMMLDTSRMSAQRLGDQTRLDASMDAALLLGALSAKAGDSVSMLAADTRVHTEVIRPARTAALAELSRAMIPLAPRLVEANWATIGAKLTELGNKVSLIVLFTALDVTVLEESLLPVLLNLAKRTRIVIAVALDPKLHYIAEGEKGSHTDDLYLTASIHHARLEREKAARALAASGISIVEAPPADLPMAVVDHYLDLKARGLL